MIKNPFSDYSLNPDDLIYEAELARVSNIVADKITNTTVITPLSYIALYLKEIVVATLQPYNLKTHDK